MDITQEMLDVAYNRGYLAYKTNAYCPYLISIGDNSALKNAWYKGKYAAQDDAAPVEDSMDAAVLAAIARQNAKEADVIARQNAKEEDVMVTLHRLEAKLDLIFFKLG